MHGSVVQAHKSKTFSKDRLFCCFVFIAAIEVNPILQTYKAANVINIFKAPVTSSGYSYTRVFVSTYLSDTPNYYNNSYLKL
jgi:hypothetical protein